jgi:hypothetical protein
MRTLFLCSLLLVGCLGGQSKQTKQDSAHAGDRSGDVPQATLAEHDWKKAAQGHGAAGTIPAADLARMDQESAPGGNIQRDAGR